MKNQWERFQEIIKAWKSSRTRKRVAMTLSGFIVFATVYMLILPAITLEKEEADNMAGISVDSMLDAGDEIYMEDEADDPSEVPMGDEDWTAEEGMIMDDLSAPGPVENGMTDDPSAVPAENEGWTAEEGASLDELSAFDLIEDDAADGFDSYEPADEKVFKEKTDNGLVTVTTDPGVLPSDVSMQVKEVHEEKTLEAVADAVEEAYLQENLQISTEISHVYAADIRFLDEEDKDVQPLDPVRLTLTAKRPVEDDETVMVIRIDEKGHAEMIEEVWTEPYKPDGEDEFAEPGKDDEADVTDGTRLNVMFEAEEASVYAAVYLVETWQDAYVEDSAEDSEAGSAAAEDDITVAAEDNAEAETVNVPEEDIWDVPALDEFANVTTNGAGAETVAEEVDGNDSQTLTEAVTEPATEEFAEAITESQTETATEKLTEATTEKQTETDSEELTEATTEEQTEPAAEDLTEAVSEEQTEAVTEGLTEATTEEETEAVTEELTEAITEEETEAVTEELTEAVTEEETETEEEKYPAQQFAGTSIGGIMVRVTADEGAFPEGTRMVVEDVEEEQVLPAIEDAVGQTQVVKVHAVNITFYDEEENEIEPRIPVNVVIRAERSAENEDVLVVHVDDDGVAQEVDDARIVEVGSRVTATVTESVVDSSEAETESFYSDHFSEEEMSAQDESMDEESSFEDEQQTDESINKDEHEISTDESQEIKFDAEGFSVYAIVYTVDFHYEVDGRMYEFSLPGGGFISFSDLIEVLGVAKTGENDDVHLPGEVPGIDNQDANEENQGENGAGNAENTGYSDVENPMEVSGIENQDATALTLDGVVVSEKTREFVADVESVVFSSPALVWVGKVDEESTVGGIKESRGLECVYSAELTEEQIEEINNTVVESGDWALISVQPFESEETLTVTMKTGEVFEIRVTDTMVQPANLWDLDGNEYALAVNVNYQDILMTSEPHSDGGKLKAQYVGDASNINNLTVNTTKWKFTSTGEYGKYYITCSEGNYLNINGQEVTISSEPQVISLDVSEAGRIRLSRDGYDVNLYDNNADNGFGGWAEDWGWNVQFRLFEVTAPSDEEFFVNVSPYGGGTVSGKFTGGTTTGDLKSFYTDVKNGYVGAVDMTGYNNYGIRAKNSDGYLFDHWELDGTRIDSITTDNIANGTLYIGADGGHVLTAVFKEANVTVTQNDINMGYVTYTGDDGSHLTSDGELSLNVGIKGTGETQNNLRAVSKNSNKYRFVRWDVSDESKVTSMGDGYSSTTDVIRPTVTGDVTFTAVFEEILDLTEPVDYSADAQALVNRLKAEMESDPAVLTKTAHVDDDDNRIYEVDLSSSSHRKVLAHGLTLAFITDVSRSMYFPANLDQITSGPTLRNDKNSAAGGWDNAYGLITWLNAQPTNTNYRVYNGKNVYYMIGDVNGTATSLALFYSGSEWKVADASYFDDLYNNGRDGINANHSRVGNSITDYIDFGDGYYRLRAGGSTNGNGSRYPLNDGVAVAQPSIYMAYETSDANSTYFTRLDYLRKAVKIASDVVYGVNDSAEIGLVTFARGSEGHKTGNAANDNYAMSLYTASQSSSFKSAVEDISLYGGTRQDFGLDTAENSGWFTTSYKEYHPQVAILVTDGAPNISGVSNYDAWTNYVKPEAEDLQKQGVELYTLGLSLDKVGSNKGSLYSIAGTYDGTNRNNDDKYKHNAENGDEIIERIMDIIRTMELNGNLLASVTDTIDPAFYPLDADGEPIQEGVYSESGTYLGTISDLLNDDGTPKTGTSIYSSDNTIKYSVWKEVDGSWQVTWYNQNIKKEKANGDAGWTQSFRVKAREDFLGGNALNTNAGQASISADRFTVEEYSEIGTFTEPVTQSVSTPRVNVVELGLDEHSTEWDIYLGFEVDPVEELKALFEEIKVQERVTKSDDDHRIDGDEVEPGDDSETYSLLEKIELEDEDWEALLDGQTVTLPYDDYGHSNVGTITVTLVKNESDEVAGEDTYSLQVTYTPNSPAPDTDYKTTPGGSPGRLADSIESDNTHTIDEYYLPNSFRIEKTDGTNRITDSPALFKLYRATKEGDPGVSVDLSRYGLTDERGYTAIETAHTLSGIANIGGLLDELGNAKDESLLMNAADGPYYLIESGAPMGYSRTRTPVKIEVIAGPNFYTDLDGNPIEVEEGETPNGLYNMTQGVTIKINDEVAAMYNADGTPATLTDGAGNSRSYLLEGDSGVYWQTTITNTPVAADLNAEQGQILPYKKTIDYLGDAQDNPDTLVDNDVSDSEENSNAINDLYRLYLDAKLFNTVTKANIIMAEDCSTSMNTVTMDGKTRHELVRDVLKGDQNNIGFIDTILDEDADNLLSVIGFSNPSESQVLVPWTDNKQTAKTGIDDSPSFNSAGVNYELAFQKIKEQINSIPTERAGYPTYVIFISDGLPTAYMNNIGNEVTAYDNMINIPEGLTRDAIDGQENIENLNWVLGTSIDAVNQFKTDLSEYNIQVCTIGLGTDMSKVMAGEDDEDKPAGSMTIYHSDPATEAPFYYSGYIYDFLLRDLASTDPSNSSLKLYRQVTTTNELRSALNAYIATPNITKVLISDELSVYVSLYANQLDLVVTKTAIDGTKTKLTVAYEASAKNYKVTDNGTEVGRIIIDGNTISLDFKDDLDYSTGNTYTLSFNVEATTKAYTDYAANNGGYGGVTGEKGTDYVSLNAAGEVVYSNGTSSEKPGFHSNKTATVAYTYEETETTGTYDNPVIQVGETKLEIQKTWEPEEPDRVTEVTIKVMRDGEQLTTVTLKKSDDWKATLEHLVPKKLLTTENDSAVRDKDGNLLKKTQYVPYVYTLEEVMTSDNATVAAILADYEPGYEFTATESNNNTSFTNITSRYDSTNNKLVYYIPAKAATDTQAAVQESDKGKAEITNYHKQDIEIIKINEDTRGEQTQTKITGAKFRLMKYNGSTYVAYDSTYGAEAGVEVGTTGDQTGKLLFENLPSGEYQIVETQTPTGYIKTLNNDIYFKIEKGVVKRYDKPASDNTRQEIPVTVAGENDTQISNVVLAISYVVDSDDSSATFTVGNIPGAALPNTGGPGTNLIYLFGIMLTGLAGTGILMKRRRRNAA